MTTQMGGAEQLALAFDIGGTAIKAGLLRCDGKLLCLHRTATPADASPDHVVQMIVSIAQELCADSGIKVSDVHGIGISIAAFITADGVIEATAHLSTEWIDYDLKQNLLSELPSEYYFALDSPAPTLGEAYYGAGQNVDHFAYVTVSTGIGAGIIAGGRYFGGGLGWAGGIGHTIIDETSDRICRGCGNAGCLETLAASQGILATTHELLRAHPDSLILSLVSGQIDSITPHTVYDAAQKGDATAREVWRRTGHALGIGLTNLVDILSPSRIVVGGGIAQAGDLLLEPARSVVRTRAFPPQHRRAEVVQAALGDLSGLYGAAAMVFHNLRINLPAGNHYES